jgi:hypothetical protein
MERGHKRWRKKIITTKLEARTARVKDLINRAPNCVFAPAHKALSKIDLQTRRRARDLSNILSNLL